MILQLVDPGGARRPFVTAPRTTCFAVFPFDVFTAIISLWNDGLGGLEEGTHTKCFHSSPFGSVQALYTAWYRCGSCFANGQPNRVLAVVFLTRFLAGSVRPLLELKPDFMDLPLPIDLVTRDDLLP